jgi:hypothetical protein
VHNAAGASFAEVQATFQAKMLAATSSRPGADSELFSPDQVAYGNMFNNI